ncbi:MAG: hypothetical protein QXE31_03795 [Candidatus Woesearchaeota archaeon]
MKRRFQYAPLSGAFMATSILGLMISIFFVYKHYPDWGITFSIVFGIMFISSIISMTVADPEEFIDLESKNKKQ